MMNKSRKVLGLVEAKSPRLNPGTRSKMNKELGKISKQIYFDSIPLTQIFAILRKYGVVAVQEDQTEWSGFLVGGRDKTEQVYFDVADLSMMDEQGRYPNVYSNTRLALSYYKMPNSGKYEIVTYMT